MVTTPQTEDPDRFSNFDFYTGEIFRGRHDRREDRLEQHPARASGLRGARRQSTNTVLRGGYGIYHDVSAMGGSTGPYQNPPYANAYAFTSDNITPVRTLSTGFPDNSQPVDPGQLPRRLDDDRSRTSSRAACSNGASTSNAKLPVSTIASVAYAGSYADRLFDKSRNLNTATPGPGFNPAARRPYPQLQAVIAALSRGWMKYNSLQFRIERRARRTGSSSSAPTRIRRRRPTACPASAATRASSTSRSARSDDVDVGSVEHRPAPQLLAQRALPVARWQGQRSLGTWTGLTEAILGGWQINTIFVAQSGYPLGMSMASSQSGTAFGNRPDRVCDGKLDDPTVQRWFDTSCFVAPGGRRARQCGADDALRAGAVERSTWRCRRSSTSSSSAPRSSTSSTTRNSRRRAPRSARRLSA